MEVFNLESYLKREYRLEGVNVYGYIMHILNTPPNTKFNTQISEDSVFAMFYATGITGVSEGACFLKHFLVGKFYKKDLTYDLVELKNAEIEINNQITIQGSFPFSALYSKSSKSVSKISLVTTKKEIELYGVNRASIDLSHPLLKMFDLTDVHGMDNFIHTKPKKEDKTMQVNPNDLLRSKILERNELEDYNDSIESYFAKVEKVLENAKAKRSASIDAIITNFYIKENTNQYVHTTIDAIVANYNTNFGFGYSGKLLLHKYMQNIGEFSKQMVGGVSLDLYIENNFVSLSNWLKQRKCVDKLLLSEEKALDLYDKYFCNLEMFYAGIVSVITSTKYSSMVSLYYKCRENDILLSVLLNKNPYLFSFIGEDIVTPQRVEILARFFNQEVNSELNSCRYITYLCQNNLLQSSSTIITATKEQGKTLGVSLSPTQYNRLTTEGSVLYQGQKLNAQIYLCPQRNYTSYPKEDVNYSTRFGYIYTPKGIDAETIIKTCFESGFCTPISKVSWSLTSVLVKDFYVLKTLYLQGKQTYNYDIKEVKRLVNEYESTLPFTLEQDQRNAASLIRYKCAVITGVAGSGKTTMIKMFIHLLKNLEPDTELHFVAPTGKAAKRMQTLLGVEAKTIHSHFGLPINGNSGVSLDIEDNEKVVKQTVCLFIDESAMVSLDVMFNVVRRLNFKHKATRLYLFGDINQLPPIGMGTPFRDILNFIPSMSFATCKRTSEESNITKMATQFIKTEYKPLQSGKDFLLLPCEANSIAQYIQGLCCHYTGIYTPVEPKLCELMHIDKLPHIDNPNIQVITDSDLQVISPVNKESYPWGTIKLNSVLEPIFNKTANDKNSYLCQTTHFNSETPLKLSVGDKVMHTKANLYSKVHYILDNDGNYYALDTDNQGIYNGDTGIIYDIVDSNKIGIIDEYEGERTNEERNWVNYNHWFIIVKYHNYNNNTDFFIFYPVEYEMKESVLPYLIGEEVTYLDLAYAISVHKDQGSQQKIIIFALYDVSYYSTFLSREMFYTAITRGEQIVFVVGNTNDEFFNTIHNRVALNNIQTLGTQILSYLQRDYKI